MAEPKPAPKKVAVEVELAAIEQIIEAMKSLDGDESAMQRVTVYIVSRFGIYIPRE